MEPDNPNGFPIAVIGSPTCRLDESPSDNGFNNFKSALTLITPMSVYSSTPIISAFYDLPSKNVTIVFVASLDICAFVIMCPCVSNTNPEPTPPTSLSV